MRELETFKDESEAGFMFGITLNKALFMMGFFVGGLKLTEPFNDKIAIFVGLAAGLVAFFIHNIFRRIFPGKRLELMVRFFSQGDLYKAKQDKDHVPIHFFQSD